MPWKRRWMWAMRIGKRSVSGTSCGSQKCPVEPYPAESATEMAIHGSRGVEFAALLVITHENPAADALNRPRTRPGTPLSPAITASAPGIGSAVKGAKRRAQAREPLTVLAISGTAIPQGLQTTLL